MNKRQEREEQLLAMVQQLKTDLDELKKPRQNPNGSFGEKTRK